ncbi:MAG: CPBP family intramembrane metalloprotease [Planctomycetota bacterium]|nr:MAG: CPBP family intramembrane metalloprotease [Planctomycetota bacterium]
MVRIAGYFYLGMALLALVLNLARGAPPVPFALGPRLVPALGWAIVGAAVTVALSRSFERRFAWARELSEWFRSKLGPLEPREVHALALASGIAEELLFRGALQPAFGSLLGSPLAGWAVATLAFGLLHFAGPERWPWTVFALVLGGYLGALQLYADNVLAPIVLHVVVNDINLRRIARPAPFLGKTERGRRPPS